jgi:hypothetical protein
VSDFDLSAAWLRKAQGDLRAFMAAFAARLEPALPGRVTVERKRDGLFSSQSHVAKVSIAAGSNVYVLAFSGAALAAQRMKAVRGVTLKTEAMEMAAWLAALNTDLQAVAEDAGAAHGVLHEFLMS